METMRQEGDIFSHQFCVRSRVVKIKNIKKQNLLYGCFKKQSTQKISNQKMKLKERDKSILEYVQCMYNNVHAYKVPGF